MGNRARFKDAEWFSELNTNITIRVGSLGSWLSLYLARTRPNRIMIYDDDKIEETNLAGQFYNYTNLGMYKVDGLYNNIRNYCNYSILKRKQDMNLRQISQILLNLLLLVLITLNQERKCSIIGLA